MTPVEPEPNHFIPIRGIAREGALLQPEAGLKSGGKPPPPSPLQSQWRPLRLMVRVCFAKLRSGISWPSSVKLMATLLITRRHQHIKLNYACACVVHRQEFPADLQTPPGITSKLPDTTRNYQHTFIYVYVIATPLSKLQKV